MKNLSLFLCSLLVLLAIACYKHEETDPIPQEDTTLQDTIPNPVDTIDTNPQDTIPQDTVVVTDTLDPIPVISTASMKFLINFVDDDIYKNAVFRVYDESWTTFATLKAANMIGVNTESWACNTAYHHPITYTDNNYTHNKTYHLIVRLFLGATATTTNDFTFQVDSVGTVFNLQTQNVSYVEDRFGVPINDVVVLCNKIIINHRRMTGLYPQDPRVQ